MNACEHRHLSAAGFCNDCGAAVAPVIGASDRERFYRAGTSGKTIRNRTPIEHGVKDCGAKLFLTLSNDETGVLQEIENYLDRFSEQDNVEGYMLDRFRVFRDRLKKATEGMP